MCNCVLQNLVLFDSNGFENLRTLIFGKAVANHSQAASLLGEHSSVVLNYWLGKGRNYEKLSMHLMLTL